MTILELSSVTSSWSESSLKSSTEFKVSFHQKRFNRKRGKSERWRRSSAGASACKLWQERREQRCRERVTGSGSYPPHQALHSQNNKAEKAFQNVFEKTRRGFEGPLKTHTLLRELKAGERTSFTGRATSSGSPPSTVFVSIRQHTSAYVIIRQHTSAYVSIRQHTSAYVSIRQHTSAYVSINQHMSAYVSIREYT